MGCAKHLKPQHKSKKKLALVQQAFPTLWIYINEVQKVYTENVAKLWQEEQT